MNSKLTKGVKRAGVYLRLTRAGLYVGQSKDYNRRYPEYIRVDTLHFITVPDAAARLELERRMIRFFTIQDDIVVINTCHASDKRKFKIS